MVRISRLGIPLNWHRTAQIGPTNMQRAGKAHMGSYRVDRISPQKLQLTLPLCELPKHVDVGTHVYWTLKIGFGSSSPAQWIHPGMGRRAGTIQSRTQKIYSKRSTGPNSLFSQGSNSEDPRYPVLQVPIFCHVNSLSNLPWKTDRLFNNSTKNKIGMSICLYVRHSSQLQPLTNQKPTNLRVKWTSNH